jgi:hypothetical protein
MLSVDLGWSPTNDKRTAIAYRAAGNIEVVRCLGGNTELINCIGGLATFGAIVLLDVPLDGTEGLTRHSQWRPLDKRLQRIQIPLLASFKAAGRGPILRNALLSCRPDLRIEESYPYAVLRVLHALHEKGSVFSFDSGSDGDLSGVWRLWPPKYKRAPRTDRRYEEMNRVADVLACVPGFVSAIRRPATPPHRENLDTLSDEFDALLGLVAAISIHDRSPWSWRAQCEGPGSIVSIADEWIRRQFENA